jgi:FkbH-like protein
MQNEEHKIKCVVWDLDNTIWDGTLLESKDVKLNDTAVKIIKILDDRGILQSISSKNNHNDAIAKLKEFGLEQYFLYPKINWQPKSQSIDEIVKNLNIGIDSFAFIDDQAFELDEVKFSLPEVWCINVDDISHILEMPQFMPRFITEDSKKRRLMYQSDIERNFLEEKFQGSKEDFLRTLDMKFTVSNASEEDLKRAEELTIRTHQLNTTGYTYSYDELNQFRLSDSHKLLISELTDKYGSYGKIGLILLNTLPTEWSIKLLLTSCRVISRGVGSVFITLIRKLAKEANVQLIGEFIPTEKNRIMYMTYKFSGFKEKEKKDNLILLENDLNAIPALPDYLEINAIL